MMASSDSDAGTAPYDDEVDDLDEVDDADDEAETMPMTKVHIPVNELLQLESKYRRALSVQHDLKDERQIIQDNLRDAHESIYALTHERDKLRAEVVSLTKDCDDIEADRDGVIADRDQIHEEYLESEQACIKAFAENEMCQLRLTEQRNGASVYEIAPPEALQIPTDRKRAREATAEYNELEAIHKALSKEQRTVIDEEYAQVDRNQAGLTARYAEYIERYNRACKRFNV